MHTEVILICRLIKYPNHVTLYYVQPCVAVHVQWDKAYAELNLT